MKKVLNLVKKAELIVMIILLLGMAGSSFSQVVFRLVLKRPLAWTEELSRYLFVWLTFIGGALVVAEGGHFKMDILTVLAKGKWIQVLNVFVNFMIFIFSMALLIYGTKLFLMVYSQKSPALRLTMSIPYFVLPLNGILSTLSLIEDTVLNVKMFFGKQKEVEK